MKAVKHVSLPCVTDPIPAGIMEEACDWDMMIEPPSKPTHKIPDIPKPEKKKQAKSEKPTLKPSREPHISTVIPERTTGDKSYSGAETKVKKHSPKPERQKPIQSTTNLQHASTLTQKEQNDTLPRIPPLPSFKLNARKAMTFNEAVADYENFITEGPGRSVEIIRQYDGFNRSRDAVNGLDNGHDDDDDDGDDNDKAYKSYALEESHSHQDLPPPQEVSELSSEQKTLSVLSDDSSTESEMEVESESSSSVPAQSSHHTPALPDKRVSELNESSLPSARVSQQTSRNKQRPSQCQNPPNHHSQTHRPASKSSRKAASAGQKGKKRETDELEEEVAGQDNWSSYRAWVEYYNSYYHHSPYNWMTAFYMNSVYIKEMMKH